MITYIVTLRVPKANNSDKDVLYTCIYTIIFPLMLWFVGFVCHLFM